jgi:uncharacterized membrane protein YhhN
VILRARDSLASGDGLDRIMLVISCIAALIFWISAMMPPYPGRWMIKWLAIASLAVIVWRQRQSPQEAWLAAALLSHSAGDVLLDIDRTGLFLPAVGAFLCGHVLYLLAFWPDVRVAQQVSLPNKSLVLAVVTFGLMMGTVIYPHLPKPLMFPIVIYMFAICAMAITAIAANYSPKWVVVGALLYLFSDALIGLDTFVSPLTLSAYLVWPAYYFGQLLIGLGFLRRKTK